MQGHRGVEVKFAITLGFSITNNEAKYEALIVGLKMALKVEVRSINVYTDS